MALFYGFLIGIVFIIFIYPLITDIYSIISQGVEYINTVIACKTARLQIMLQKNRLKPKAESRLLLWISIIMEMKMSIGMTTMMNFGRRTSNV